MSVQVQRRANAEFRRWRNGGWPWFGVVAGGGWHQAARGGCVGGCTDAGACWEILSGIPEQAQMRRGWEAARCCWGATTMSSVSIKGAVLQEVAYMSYPAAKGWAG